LQIVIALPLGMAITSQHVTRRAWIGAVFVVVGVGLFLAATHPGDGRSTAPGGVWLAATGLLAALIALAAIIGARRRPAARAAFFGAAAGLFFGYQAAVMKTFVDVVPGGLGAILSSWTTYALIASALGGFYFLQSALQIGVLAPAIASSNATSPITSVALGRVIFLETTQRSNGGRILSAVSAGLLLAGVIVLAREPRP
jgi:drug/metabolite transporter (DMT)-like permease